MSPSPDKPSPKPSRIPAVVLVIAVLLPLLNALPTWNGYLDERLPDRVFLGFRYMAGDHYQYASFVRQAADEGRFFMENRFTTEPQQGRYLLLYMWLAGQVCRFTGLDVPAAWEVLRFLSGIFFMLAAWSFAGRFFPDRKGRMLAYVLVAFSGGVGYLLYLITGEPGAGITVAYLKDAWNYQWNWSTFSSMLVPMWVAPAAIFVVCGAILAREKAAGMRDAILLFALPPLIWFMHPYSGLAAYAAFGLYPLIPAAAALWSVQPIPWPKVGERLRAVLPALASFAVVAAYMLWARKDAVYAVNGQRVFTWNPTYSVFLYPFAYGLLLPLALFGMKWASSIPEKARHVTIAWLAAAVVLSVNPFLSGVKFQYLIHMPLALFAAHGILELRKRSKAARAMSSGLGAVVFGALLFAGTPLILLKDVPKTAGDADIYLSTPEIDAMKFLKEQPQGAVLCTTRSGNRIAWLSEKKVYLGHWFLTIDINTKGSEVAAFFDRRVPADQKLAWLHQKGLAYVYAGPEEKSLGGVDEGIGLRTIYDKGGVTIYTVP